MKLSPFHLLFVIALRLGGRVWILSHFWSTLRHRELKWHSQRIDARKIQLLLNSSAKVIIQHSHFNKLVLYLELIQHNHPEYKFSFWDKCLIPNKFVPWDPSSIIKIGLVTYPGPQLIFHITNLLEGPTSN